ncbi:hypothetical protein SVAN01_01586 [Stagonosporopsis vannaccii]|nr:hypothetical protein SVAN01_01586 [Stagonosporopsis vannaccii]
MSNLSYNLTSHEALPTTRPAAACAHTFQHACGRPQTPDESALAIGQARDPEYARLNGVPSTSAAPAAGEPGLSYSWVSQRTHRDIDNDPPPREGGKHNDGVSAVAVPRALVMATGESIRYEKRGRPCVLQIRLLPESHAKRGMMLKPEIRIGARKGEADERTEHVEFWAAVWGE